MISQEPFCGVRTNFYHDASSYDMFRDRRVVEKCVFNLSSSQAAILIRYDQRAHTTMSSRVAPDDGYLHPMGVTSGPRGGSGFSKRSCTVLGRTDLSIVLHDLQNKAIMTRVLLHMCTLPPRRLMRESATKGNARFQRASPHTPAPPHLRAAGPSHRSPTGPALCWVGGGRLTILQLVRSHNLLYELT